MRSVRQWLSAAFFVSLLALPGSASAALTPSEKAQIRDFYRDAAVSQAQRIRALVARPDLTAAESADALHDAVEPVAFTPARAQLMHEVLFGSASDASRLVVAPAVVRALLARADAILAKGQSEDTRVLSRDATELLAIYTFMTREIADKPEGQPTSLARTAREECVKALAEHIEKNARVLRPDGGATPFLAPRAQADVALFDMQPDGPMKRVDTADKLAIKGARRQMLAEWGMLVVDGKNIDDAKLHELRGVFERVPAAHGDVRLVVLGDPHADVVAHGRVLHLASDLVTAPASIWGNAVEGGDSSPLAGVIGEIARSLTQRALDNRGELRTRAERDASGSDYDRTLGKPLDSTVEGTIAAVVQILLVDGARTFDWALVRAISAHPESIGLLSDAIGVLAAVAPPHPGFDLTVPLGKPASSGGIELLLGTNVRLFPNGAASAITFGGHTYTFERDETTADVRTVRRDGQPINLSMLPSARMPLSEMSSWSYGGIAFVRLLGAPRAGMGPGPHVRLEVQQSFDAIATPAPGDDFVFEGELSVEGGEGGIGFRAKTMRDMRAKTPFDFMFGGLVSLSPDGASSQGPRIALETEEENAHRAFMAAPADGPFSSPMHVRIQVKGTKVDARVGNAAFHGTLPASMKDGSIVIYGKRGAKVEVNALTIKKL